MILTRGIQHPPSAGAEAVQQDRAEQRQRQVGHDDRRPGVYGGRPSLVRGEADRVVASHEPPADSRLCAVREKQLPPQRRLLTRARQSDREEHERGEDPRTPGRVGVERQVMDHDGQRRAHPGEQCRPDGRHRHRGRHTAATVRTEHKDRRRHDPPMMGRKPPGVTTFWNNNTASGQGDFGPSGEGVGSFASGSATSAVDSHVAAGAARRGKVRDQGVHTARDDEIAQASGLKRSGAAESAAAPGGRLRHGGSAES
ncbi:hypothetical protein E2651_38570 [Streptomyces sp. MZ04]|nr:hypothetical protein E2651_38570 [Streptomyces sp. MZ04]